MEEETKVYDPLTAVEFSPVVMFTESELERYVHKGRAYACPKEAKSDVESLIEGRLDIDAILSDKLKAPNWEDIEAKLEDI